MYDITNDTNLEFLQDAIYSAPVKPLELIKTANVNIDYDNAPADIFADPVERKFPIHTPADAAISALYIYKQASVVDDDVKQNVEQVLREYGLDELTILLNGEQEMEKVASDEEFLLPSKRKFPAFNPDMLEKSAAAIEQNWNIMPLADKVEAATNLVKVASEMDMEVPVWAKIYGQQTACNLHKVASELGVRYALTQHEGYKEVMDKVKSLYKQAGEPIIYDTALARGIVFQIWDLDKVANVSYEDVNDPFVVVFNEPYAEEPEMEKVASDETVTIGGVEFYKDSLVDFFESSDGVQFLGDDLYKQASEPEYNGENAIAVVLSLPAEAQEVIASALTDSVDY